MIKLIDEEKRKEAATSLLKEMESTAARMRALIVSMSAHDLIGYIYAQHMMKAMAVQCAAEERGAAEGYDDLIGDIQFLLEYVHAVLASDVAPENVTFDEAQCTELFELGRRLREQAMLFAMASSSDNKTRVFGPDTADIEFRAKSNWVLLRGNRYQVLEKEFYSYVLAPHDDMLTEIYGIGAADIAAGFQEMANAARSGHADAGMEMNKQFEAAQAFAALYDGPKEKAMEAWIAANAEQAQAAGRAVDDIFRGGITNVSRHTMLPPTLLADLAFQRGGETDFFAPGDYAGTPYRTLPARKKPLIQLGEDYYAIDPCFARDAGYRALLFNLLNRRPDYAKPFRDRQKTMSEAAFADILSDQLPNAVLFQEVYYRDRATNQWAENDTLILVDDVLLLVEAKAGAAATIASPALDFGRHAQSVQDLVLKAYKQCERFFNYVNSADEVPLYRLEDGKYVECGRLRRSDYRVMVPIGLTVESFSPFSTYCKELPEIKPLLGKHAFVSLSIDDLFVLKRLLPTPGEFAHYMEVRQAVAGMRRAHLFDEFDHLGAYLKKNRFDLEIADQLRSGDVTMVIWDGMSDIVDQCFEGEDWESNSFPTQVFSDEVLRLLGALNMARARGWLSAESRIRDLGEKGRTNLAKMLSEHCHTLNLHPTRYFLMCGDDAPLFIWLQRCDHEIDWARVKDKASAAALVVKAPNIIGILVEVEADGAFRAALPFVVPVPTARTAENDHVYEDATRMARRTRMLDSDLSQKPDPAAKTKKPGRNEPCPCGSGLKYKKCHGR